jgi:aspartate/methionine/tyrosine aminotransferase
MSIRPFQLERYFGQHEFTVRYHLCCSDCETLSVGELLDLAGLPVSALADLRLGYTESQGNRALRERVAAFYREAGAEDIVITNAPEEGIFVAMEALLQPGERVVVQTPCYQSLMELARHKGCDVQPWPVRETADGWELDLDGLDALLAPGAGLLVLNFPHNPTGLLPTEEEYRLILEKAGRAGTRVFSDEMYRGLEPTADKRLPAGADLSADAVSLWGMSKTFGLPGLRIGWLVTRDRELRDRLLRIKDYTTICSSAPGELLARAGLEASDHLIRRNLAIIRENLGATGEFMERRKDLFHWLTPAAGPVALARLRSGSAESLCRRAREEAGVLLAPSTLFELGDSHIRFGLGRRAYGEGLRILESWLARRAAAP